MLFYKSMETTTTARDIYTVVKQYFNECGNPITNLISTIADGALALMGKHNGVLKLLKNDNRCMVAVLCIIHREILMAAFISGPNVKKSY